ncbi:sterol desaturase family protein [bacterium]|nr:sterol desaturase family protein [bacterium]
MSSVEPRVPAQGRTGARPPVAPVLAFPLILGATLALALILLPRLGAPLTLLIAQTFGLVAVAVVEHRLPFRREWNRSHGDVGTDVVHAVVSGVGSTQLARPLAGVLGVLLAGALSGSVGLDLWPRGWPLLAQLVLALVIVELPQYWLHRWQHEHDWLWRFHSVHHSAPRLYWLNAARFHPVDLGLLYLVGYVPLIALGCPEETIMLFALFDAVFGMLQHCNIDVRLGPLNYVFSMAEPHRWHHSLVLEEANTNYGSNLIIWDLAFGSFFLPTDREPPAAIGIADMPDFPQTWPSQMAAPFRWRSLPRLAGGAPAPPPQRASSQPAP